MKSTEELIDDVFDLAECQMQQLHKKTLLEAANRLEELLSALKQIAAMDYTRAATNGMGFDVVKIATRAINGKGGK